MAADPRGEMDIMAFVARFPHTSGACGRVKLLGHHNRYGHGIVALPHRYARGARCQVCGMEFHHRARLIKHLQRCPACLQQPVEDTAPVSDGELEQPERKTAAERRCARAAGRCLLEAHFPAACV